MRGWNLDQNVGFERRVIWPYQESARSGLKADLGGNRMGGPMVEILTGMEVWPGSNSVKWLSICDSTK